LTPKGAEQMRRNSSFLPARREWEGNLSPWSPGGFASLGNFARSPWQMMRRMQEEMDRAFGQFFEEPFGPDWLPATSGRQGAMQAWAPNLDISQTDKEWLLEVDLPGVKQEDIDIQVRDHSLFVSAEMKSEESFPGTEAQAQSGEQPQGNGSKTQQAQQQGQQRQYERRERRYGYFERQIPLPENVNEDQISCEFRNGVLMLHLPKSEQAVQQGRRIPIGQGEPTKALGQQTSTSQQAAGQKQPATAGAGERK